MNKSLVVFCLAILGVIAWWKWDNISPWVEQVRVMVQTGGKHEEASPSQDSSADNASSTTPGQPTVRLIKLPESVYVVRERLNFTAEGGLRSIEPGTQVRKIGESNGRYLIESRGVHTVVEASKLTRDPLELGQMEQRAIQARGALAAQVQAQISALDSQITSLQAEVKERVKKDHEASADATSKSKVMTTNLDFLQNEIVRLQKQKAMLNAQALQLAPPPPPPPAKH